MSKRAVVVVALQNEYLPTGKLPLAGIDQALDNAARVIAAARSKGDLLVHVRHESAQPGIPFFSIRPMASGSTRRWRRWKQSTSSSSTPRTPSSIPT